MRVRRSSAPPTPAPPSVTGTAPRYSSTSSKLSNSNRDRSAVTEPSRDTGTPSTDTWVWPAPAPRTAIDEKPPSPPRLRVSAPTDAPTASATPRVSPARSSTWITVTNDVNASARRRSRAAGSSLVSSPVPPRGRSSISTIVSWPRTGGLASGDGVGAGGAGADAGSGSARATLASVIRIQGSRDTARICGGAVALSTDRLPAPVRTPWQRR